MRGTIIYTKWDIYIKWVVTIFIHTGASTSAPLLLRRYVDCVCACVRQAVAGELERNAQRAEYLEQAALYLMQKCEPSDAVLVERDLAAFRAEHQKVKDTLSALRDSLAAEQQVRQAAVAVCDVLLVDIIYTVLHCFLHAVRYTLCSVQCVLYAVLCILLWTLCCDIMFCILCAVHFVL